ncbi:MAG: efflux RND transporter periplasmic adaptor subunit [Candidatus Kryptonium sp.]|nr:efflux RND transporter periplasmic adaptor subunit [Candidatus Kryptonium sp.]MCX7761484.1 efflux RND transporter periplasmic adaptor subunit [Candidatus Kryptonium sp.]MDW8109528.1 efflux RND transporter periplasmic adaptor subunit [Candidatus Kryptonium sp.]
MKKKLIRVLIIVLVLIVAGLAVAFYLNNRKSGNLQLKTAKADVGTIEVYVTTTGTLNPVTLVQVGTQVSGTIAKIYVDFNDVVKKGQIIAQLDSTFLAAQVKDAEAQVERARAQVNQAQRDLSRIKELFAKNLVSQADYDQALTNYETALAQLKSAEAQLERARVNLKYSTIYSPIDGIVISRNVDVGQTVAASLQAPTLFTIANDLRKMRVEANVDEADIGKVKPGQTVLFTVDAYPEETFVGRVAQVRLQPINVQNVINYAVIIDVDNNDLKLRPGMTANVRILIDKRENVLRIPNQALRFKPDPEDKRFAKAMEEMQRRREEFMKRRQQEGGGPGFFGQAQQGQGGPRFGGGFPGGNRATIWVLDENKNPKPVFVRTGITDGNYTEIVGGNLKEGDEIITGYAFPTTTVNNPQTPQPFQFRGRTPF